ncbi:MAG TPA: preprotein translocase subunit YajC [Rhizomicrobium sp.]|nr:preprotein translocase subunit YajC [Rhizomicrobium sp.]
MNMSDPMFQTLTLIVPMLAIFYFLLWRPQQQRAKQLREQVDNLRRGDTVVTAGIVGRVVKASDKEDPEILVEIADNVQVKVLKASLSDVRAKAQAEEKN